MAENTRTVRLDPALYPPDAVDAAITAYAPFCRVERLGPDHEIRIILGAEAPEHTIDEFLAYALGAALERHLVELETRR